MSGTQTVPEFEATSTYCYRFARYTVLPEIIAEPGVQSGQAVRLIDFVKEVVARHLTPDQQAMVYYRAESKKPMSVIQSVKWYVPFVAKHTKQLVPLGDGMFRLPDATDIEPDDLEDSALEDGDVELADADGYVYAFSFPMLIRTGSPFPIKVGMTAVDVQQRVLSQCKGAAAFDNPQVLGSWKVSRVAHVEKAVHKVLAARGRWREQVPGSEWFDTTLDEIQAIIDFTTGGKAKAE